MPSQLSRLIQLFPGYKPTPTPIQRAALVKRVQQEIDHSTRRPSPSTAERVPANYHGGIAGRVWFLPYQDSVTKDSADIRAAMRLMRRDPYVKAAWEPQILSVCSQDWQMQPAEEGHDESEQQAEFVQRVIEDYIEGGMPQLVRAIASPWGDAGYSLAEKVWGYAQRGRLQGKIVCTAVKAKDGDHVKIEGDRHNNVRTVQSLRAQGQPRFPISDFIFSRYMTVYDEPLGQAAFRQSYASYWMRDTVRKLRVIHHEKRMAGTLMGTYENPDDRGPLEDALARAKTSTWLAVPEGTRVEAIELSTASEPDYKSFDESLRDEIVTGIAFATLQILMGNVPDARGDSKVQKAIFELGPWLISTLVTDAINTQLIPDLIDYNFPYAAGGSYPKVSFGAVSNQEHLELLQLIEGAQRIGLTPSKSYYAKAFGIQQADPNDPEDALAAPGMGGLGGFPPTDPFGGGGGGFPPADPFGGAGDPALLPPDDGMGGGGAVSPFSDDAYWHAFRDPVKWQRQATGTWKSEGGRVLSDEAYQRHVGRLKQRATAPRSSPDPPKVETPTGHVPAAKSGWRLTRGLKAAARRVATGAKATARVAKAGAKKAARVAKAAPAAAGRFGAKKTGKIAEKVTALGTRAKRLKGLEKRFGIGRAIEKTGQRAEIRAKAIDEAYKRGLLPGLKQQGREFLRAFGVHWKESRRKYGVLPAVAIEGACLAFAFVKGALLRAATLPPLNWIPGIGIIRKFVGMMLGPVARKVIEFPFKTTHRALSSSKRNPNARGRIPAGRTGMPFSEFVDDLFDPMEMVLDLRRMVDDVLATTGEPPTDATDEQLLDVLDLMMGMVEEEAQRAETFAEELDYDAFAYKAARTKRGTVKAIGTGKDAKPDGSPRILYGQAAREALARSSGADGNQALPRKVTYDARDEEGKSRRVTEENVPFDRARAMAIASKIAAADGDTSAPRSVKVRRMRKKVEKLKSAAERAAQGDPQAAGELRTQATQAMEAALPEIAQLPPVPEEEVKAAVAEAMGPRDENFFGDIGQGIENFFAGVFGMDRDPGSIAGKVGGFVNWLVRKGTKALWFGVKKLAQVARWALTTDYEGRRAIRPLIAWGATVAAFAGIFAAPALLTTSGLLDAVQLSTPTIGLLLGVPAAFLIGRAAVRQESNMRQRAANAPLPLADEIPDPPKPPVRPPLSPTQPAAGIKPGGAAIRVAPLKLPQVATLPVEPKPAPAPAPAPVSPPPSAPAKSPASPVLDDADQRELARRRAMLANKAAVEEAKRSRDALEQRARASGIYVGETTDRDGGKVLIAKGGARLQIPSDAQIEQAASQDAGAKPSPLPALKAPDFAALKTAVDNGIENNRRTGWNNDTRKAEAALEEADRQIDEYARTNPTELVRAARQMTGEEPKNPDHARRMLRAWVAQILETSGGLRGKPRLDENGNIPRMSEARALYHAFGFTAARSRSGGPKAIGAGEDQGEILYGDEALAVLQGKAGKPAQADAKPDLMAAVELAKTGDPKALKNIRDAGQTAGMRAMQELAKYRPDPGEVKSAFLEATGPRPTRGYGSKVLDGIENFLIGATVGGGQGGSGLLGRVVGWLTKLPFRMLRFGVKTLLKFGKWMFEADIGGGKRSIRPMLFYLGSLATAAAVLAAPHIAVAYGMNTVLAGVVGVPLTVAGVMGVVGRMEKNAWRKEREVAEARSEMSELRSTHFGDSTDSEVALAGVDGARAVQLLSAAKAHGTNLLAELTQNAVTRLFAEGDPLSATVLFDDHELARIQHSLAGTIASADLLGRARIRRRAELAEKRAQAPATFADSDDDPFDVFAEPVPPLQPKEAIGYFNKLVPTLGTNANRYGPMLDRHAFTLAVATDQTVLERVKEAIAKRLAGEADPGSVAADIEDILKEAGVSPKSPQYSELVYRTNAMDAYNQGAAAELQAPEMQEAFPAYEYLGILDTRTGDDHRPRIGKYFPSSASFAEVRGNRVFNCRCSFRPIHRSMMEGIRVEERW